MAAPAGKTMKDLNGKWVLNKRLSDSLESTLALQGVSFLVRTGAGLATITVTIRHFEAVAEPPATGLDPVPHIHVRQSASGIATTQEYRVVDGLPRAFVDSVFGAVIGRSRWVALEDIDDDFLKSGWPADALESDGSAAVLLWNSSESEARGWVTTQIWGFREVDGERRYCRNVLVRKGDKRVECRLIYDYVGPVDES